MRATVGDRLVQHGRVVGRQDQVSEVVEVMGAEGRHEAVMSPGPDCEIKHDDIRHRDVKYPDAER
jgi:hypothetical protein